MRALLKKLFLVSIAAWTGGHAHSATERLIPTAGAHAPAPGAARADFEYDPTSVYDQKGMSAPRGFSGGAPAELIDPFSGNLILRHTDLQLPGLAGLDLTVQRVYNSKIHRNYATRASGDINGMLFVPPSPLGLGWTLHLGRLVGAVSAGPNSGLSRPRYYEQPDGSQHPFFAYSGPFCGNGTSDVCLLTKGKDNPYRSDPNEPWHLATRDGLNITFDHRASSLEPQNPTTVDYATLIRDVHGNQIQIVYHDDTIDIGGQTYQYDYLRHFIDRIIDSVGRQIVFGYSVVNPGVIRLTSITANGRTYRYVYSIDNPWPDSQAFLGRAEPPEGAPWLYEYGGLQNGECADNSKRWCELTRITYPSGGSIDYTFAETVFHAQDNAMAVRAIEERQTSGPEAAPGTWTYQYNRAVGYTGDEHTVITRPDGSQEVYTYFGIANGAYNPQGLAWKVGSLLKQRMRDAGGAVLETQTYEWEPSAAISGERWGDHFISFDTGVFVPHLHKRTLQRGNLQWTVTNTTFNSLNDMPRCTVEEASDGAKRHRLRIYEVIEVPAQNIHFWDLPAAQLLSYAPPTAAQCDEDQASQISAAPGDELHLQTYDDEGQLVTEQANGIRADSLYNGDGTIQATIVYRGRQQDGTLTDGHCTVFGDYLHGVAQQVTHGAAAPACSGGAYSVRNTVDWFGSAVSTSVGSGVAIEFDYDGLGRVKEIRPLGETPMRITYPLAGGFSNRKRVEQGNYWVEHRFDGFAKKVEVRSSAADVEHRTYDALGRIVFQSLPTASGEALAGDTMTYDEMGRLESVTHPDGTAASYAYGNAAHNVTITDEKARQTVQTFQSFGSLEDSRLARVQLPGEAAPASDTYAYLVNGALRTIDYAGRQRTVDYNFAKLVAHEYNPESGHVYYGYDPAGDLRCRDRTSASYCNDGNLDDQRAEVRFHLDGAGRTTQVLYNSASTPNATFTFNDRNQLASMTAGAGAHTFTYTSAGRLAQKTSVVNAISYTTRYTYDELGNLETLSYPSGRLVTYARDAANRITSVRDATRTYVSDVDHHPGGVPSRTTYGNGVVATQSLDRRHRPEVLSVPGVMRLSYDHDGVGNVTRIVDSIHPDNTTLFGHDALDRLTSASGAWGTLGYTYNAGGDRLSETVDGNQPTTYGYDAAGRLAHLSGATTLAFVHDPYGNLIQRVDPGLNSFDYEFDLENRITKVSRTLRVGPNPISDTVVTYSYDGDSRRILAERPGCGSIVYHHDAAGNRIAESTPTGLMLKEYIVANGRAVAEIDVRPLRASPEQIDFGPVDLGQTTTAFVRLSNRSNRSLPLSGLSVPAPFSLPSAPPAQLSPNGSVDLAVAFAPTAGTVHFGELSGCVDGFLLKVPLHGSGGTPQPNLSLSSVDLGNIGYGAEATRKVMVVNGGSGLLLVAGWTSSDSRLSMTPAGPVTIQPGQQHEFTLVLDTLQSCGGFVSGYLQLQSNAHGGPHRVAVQGTIQTLRIETPELDFGPLAAGGSRALEVAVTNEASLPIQPVITLSGAPQFRLGAPSPASIAPGATIYVPLEYQPQGSFWSPFGDHATLRVRFPGCSKVCGQPLTGLNDVHLIGNVPDVLVPGGGFAPFLAGTGDTLHLASLLINGSNVSVPYGVRSSAGAWTQTSPAAEQVLRSVQPVLLAGPGGRVTLVYTRAQSPLERVFVQRTPSQSGFGAPCVATVGRYWGFVPVALDAAGSVWLLRGQGSQPDTVELGPVLSAQGTCLASQAPPIQFNDPVAWSFSARLSAGPTGLLYLVGWRNTTVYIATIDPVGNSVDIETFEPSGSVVSHPALAIDGSGAWHLVYHDESEPGSSLFYASRSASGVWSEPRQLVEDSPSGDYPRIAADAAGGLYVAAYDGSCHALYSYATKPAGTDGWQVSDVSPKDAALPGRGVITVPSSDSGLDLFIEGDRLTAVWVASPYNFGNNGKLMLGQIVLPTPETPLPPLLAQDGTVTDGQPAEIDFQVPRDALGVEVEFHLKQRERTSCQVELRIRKPDGTELGPHLVEARQRKLLAEASPGTWSLRFTSSGGCLEAPFHVEVRLRSGAQRPVGFAENALVLAALLLLIAWIQGKPRSSGTRREAHN